MVGCLEGKAHQAHQRSDPEMAAPEWAAIVNAHRLDLPSALPPPLQQHLERHRETPDVLRQLLTALEQQEA